jgi:hypothetical protein
MREGRENRKKSTASVLVFDRRSHEAFGTLKNVAFLTYTVTSGVKTALPRVGTSPGEISTSPGLVFPSPGLVPTIPGLVPMRRVLRFSPSDDDTP